MSKYEKLQNIAIGLEFKTKKLAVIFKKKLWFRI
jgi:hypothetical protein